MLSFVTTQAIVLSKAMQRSTTPKDTSAKHPPRTRKTLLRRFFNAVFEGRARRAEIEAERHRRFYEDRSR